MPLRQLTPSLRVVRGQTQTRTNENLCYILVRVVRFLRRVSCLQDLKQPFKDDLLPPAPFAGTRTLVLDLEDTLVHYEWDVRTPTSLLVTTPCLVRAVPRPSLCPHLRGFCGGVCRTAVFLCAACARLEVCPTAIPDGISGVRAMPASFEPNACSEKHMRACAMHRADEFGACADWPALPLRVLSQISLAVL